MQYESHTKRNQIQTGCIVYYRNRNKHASIINKHSIAYSVYAWPVFLVTKQVHLFYLCFVNTYHIWESED